ncbi:HAD family hydrolase [Salinarimonas ramus]|uniref:Sugar transferase n=1 Tax=Salinarimonas ramus TaxID=690164 RepID=A0A917V8N7_9HYPH|nr:HAD family hydrolase [Salinarimonas ramus]GGK49510.1 sugar transferase [Salinarimonas ramus]
MRNEPTAQTPLTGLVVFDCDGVLVDSETVSARVLVVMAADLGLSFTHEEALAFLRGRKVATWVAELEARLDRAIADAFIPAFRSAAASAFERELEAVPHVESALSRIAAPFCTASSAPREKIRQTLGLTGLLPHFEGRIYSAYEVGHWKPDPRLFLHAAKDMGAAPQDCIVVEDSLVGVQAGVAAGMTVLAYAPGDTAPMLADAGATPFSCMTELPGLLAEWRPGSVLPENQKTPAPLAVAV